MLEAGEIRSEMKTRRESLNEWVEHEYYLCRSVVVDIILEPVGRVRRVDEPVDVDTVVVWHERRVVENCGQ